MADRLVLLERYHSRWDRLQGDGWRRVALPTHTKRVLEGDIFGCIEEPGKDRLDAHSIQLPYISREVRLKQWVVRGLPKCNVPLKINLEVDLLVVPKVIIEGWYVFQSFSRLHGGDSRLGAFWIHILRLSEGFPHPLPGERVQVCGDSCLQGSVPPWTLHHSRCRSGQRVLVNPHLRLQISLTPRTPGNLIVGWIKSNSSTVTGSLESQGPTNRVHSVRLWCGTRQQPKNDNLCLRCQRGRLTCCMSQKVSWTIVGHQLA